MPAGLRAAASSVIGASQPTWRVVKRDGRLVAAGGGVRGSFDRGGVTLSAASGSVRLVLAGVGRGVRLTPARLAAPVAWGNSVAYRGGGVLEWYRSGPLGIEQGFTLSHRPAAGSGQVAISLRLRGPSRAALAHGEVVFLNSGGRVALRYGGLSAADAAGRRLPTHIELHGALLTLRVSDLGARYPLRIDPFILGAKLTGGLDETGNGHFGQSVALSADGNTALIGGPFDKGGMGAAWVFTRSGSTWRRTLTLTGGTGETGEGWFGWSVALSADGSTALIGGPGDNGEAGAAWVFTRSGSTWSRSFTLTGSDAAPGVSQFGFSVALSADGSTALIGGPLDNRGMGAAWVFTPGVVGTRVGWVQQGPKLTGTGAEMGAGQFGSSVALSADASTALIGGPGDSGFVGAAWLFTRLGSAWSRSLTLTGGTDETGHGWFGWSVALSADGNTALIGGPNDNNFAGAAWVFTRSGSTWSRSSTLTGNNESYGAFGSGVALSTDGNTAVIGGSSDNNFAGAAWVFVRSAGAWTRQGAKLTGNDETGNGSFGSSVALGADGNTALIGGYEDNNFAGAAWAFAAPPAVSGVTPSAGPPAGGTAVTITGSGLGGARAVSFGSTPAASFVVNSPSWITAVSPPGAIGPIDVTVTTSYGTSATGSADTFTYATAPGAPTALLANASDGQASVAFTAPPANGSPVTTYTVTASPGGAHATGPASPIPVAGLSNGTTYTLTVTATNALGTGPPSAPSNPVTPTGPSILVAPALSGLRLSPALFRAAPRGPTALAAADTNKTHSGTLVSYADSQAATTTFTVLQPQTGAHRGNLCVKAPQHPPKQPQFKRCTRLVALGSFAHTDGAGQNQLRFTGRISGRRLRPGPYQLRAVARNATGNTSPPLTTRFQIEH